MASSRAGQTKRRFVVKKGYTVIMTNIQIAVLADCRRACN
jgi:hypothetical protein